MKSRYRASSNRSSSKLVALQLHSPLDLNSTDNEMAYLLRRELKVTTHAGRNSSRRSVLMVLTSSRAKLNNFCAGDKLNSHFRKSNAVRHEEQIAISAVGKTAKFTFSSPEPWPTPKTTGRIALMMLGTSEMDSPASN